MERDNPRAIIHFNITSFSVAVERVRDSSLKSKAVIVVPALTARTVVYDMSDEAYGDGVRSGMTIEASRRFCKNAVIIPYDLCLYRRAMKVVFKKVRDFSPLVEVPDDKGHIFADVTGTTRLLGDSAQVASRIRKLVATDLSLNSAWSIAPNKLVAKAAIRTVKPYGERIVKQGEEASFLAPLPVEVLPLITQHEKEILSEFKLAQIGQVAKLSKPQLKIIFGNRAALVHQAVRGIDSSRVLGADKDSKIILKKYDFLSPALDRKYVENILFNLVCDAGGSLRDRGLVARRVGVAIDYYDAKKVIRQATDKAGAFDDISLFEMAQKALNLAWRRRACVSCLKLCLDRLVPQSSQILLVPALEAEKQKTIQLFKALDTIKNRCGKNSINFGRGLRASAS